MQTNNFSLCTKKLELLYSSPRWRISSTFRSIFIKLADLVCQYDHTIYLIKTLYLFDIFIMIWVKQISNLGKMFFIFLLTTVKFSNILVGIVSLTSKLTINDNVHWNEFKMDCTFFFIQRKPQERDNNTRGCKGQTRSKLYCDVIFMVYDALVYRVHVKYNNVRFLK